MENTFLPDFMDVVNQSRNNNWRDNWDWRRYGRSQPPSMRTQIRTAIKDLLVRLRLRELESCERMEGLEGVSSHREELQWLYERLVDQASKKTLLDVLAYRALGDRKIKLPLNTAAYWAKIEELERKARADDEIKVEFLGWKLNLHDLTDEGYPIRLYGNAPGLHAQLLLEQYRCVTPDRSIEVKPGDVVIDCGGCYGDTALYFAHKAGEQGRVLSFEFMPVNIDVFNRNLALNPMLAPRVEIVPNPVWSSSGDTLYVEGTGPGTRVTPQRASDAALEVRTRTIDDLAFDKGLAKVDFIKMDIEGAELEALKGAERTIRASRPRLAISVYHRFADYWQIAQWIDSLGLGYRFHLRHFTIHSEETVLFAEVPVRA
jgi:FkbM family methyltransferase